MHTMVPEIMDYILGKNEDKLEETPEEWKDILEMENEAIEIKLNMLFIANSMFPLFRFG